MWYLAVQTIKKVQCWIFETLESVLCLSKIPFDCVQNVDIGYPLAV